MTHHKIIIYNSLKMKNVACNLDTLKRIYMCKNTMVLKLILLHHKMHMKLNIYESLMILNR